MGMQYQPALPQDRGMSPMQEFAFPILAKARYGSENAVASSVISVTHDTTALTVGAFGTGAVLRWVATTDTQASVISAAGTANFDEIIPPNAVRRFVIPMERQGTNPGSVQGANRLNGLYQRVAVKSTGIGSVLVAEF